MTLIKKLSKRESEGSLISRMKAEIKKDPAVIEKFEEYGVSLDEIDKVSVNFVELDVSAKTKNKKIYINEKFSDDIEKSLSYLCHEIIHLAQQISGNIDGIDKEEYLDKDTEIEAFQAQIDRKKRTEGDEEAERYIDHLLSYHKVPKSEQEDKKEELLDD